MRDRRISEGKSSWATAAGEAALPNEKSRNIMPGRPAPRRKTFNTRNEDWANVVIKRIEVTNAIVIVVIPFKWCFLGKMTLQD